MTRYSDDELWRLYDETVETAHQSKNEAAWAAVLSATEELEQAHPHLRNPGVVAELLGNRFVSDVRELGRPIPDDCKENVAKLVLLFDKPLVASPVLTAMLKNLDDPIEGLGNAIRMAEVTMNAKFTRLTPEESREAIFNRFMQYSEGVGDHLEEPEARKAVTDILEKAEELRQTGIKFEDLSEYASKRFIEHLQSRGLLTRQEIWYRDSITFCIQMHMDPHVAAVAILQMALHDPDPTRGLAAILDSARGSV
jgi:hypothetical protein